MPTARERDDTDMGNYSRWDEIKTVRWEPTSDDRVGVERILALAQVIYDLRSAKGLGECALTERIGTTQSVISRLEEGGSAKNRLDTVARLVEAPDRHPLVSLPREESRSPQRRVPVGLMAPAINRAERDAHAETARTPTGRYDGAEPQ